MDHKIKVFVLLHLWTISQINNVRGTVSSDHCSTDNSKVLTCNYIPKYIADGVFHVKIENFAAARNITLEVNETMFASGHWARIQHLELSDETERKEVTLFFTSSCFKNLKKLGTLEFHITQAFELHPGAFVGLDRVTTLDVSNCGRLDLGTLTQALNGTDKLQSLKVLKISQISYKLLSVDLDETIGEIMKSKVIERFEAVNTGIKNFPTHFLSLVRSLKFLNLSYSAISDGAVGWPWDKKIYLDNLESLDLSHVTPPKLKYPIPSSFTNFSFKYNKYEENGYYIDLLLAPKSVNISGVLNKEIWIQNLTFRSETDLEWNVEELVFKENNIKYLDINMNCSTFKAYTLQKFDISNNGLQFLHPSIPSCFPNVTHLDLSNNELHVMLSVNLGLFEALFTNISKLEILSLSGNRLSSIPKNLFQSNNNLEILDLSNNRLEQVTFTLSGATNLKSLLLHNNQIKILNSISITNLINIPNKQSMTRITQYSGPINDNNNSEIHTNNGPVVAIPNRHNTITVTLHGNMLSCAVCNSKAFLHWLLFTDLVKTERSALTCMSENQKVLPINDKTLKYVDGICRREFTIITSSTSAGVFAMFLSILAFIIYKRQKLARKMKNIRNVIRCLRNGEDQYEFAVFLSYSSEDDDFVRLNVHEQLDQSLRLATNIQRKLICVGDLNLRPGFMVLDETIRCMQRSALVLIVVSNNFCNSSYCHTELQQAYQLRKPILLILKGIVDEGFMTPVMKLLFKENVRVLFTENEGEYILKNTWENVCKSILELIATKI